MKTLKRIHHDIKMRRLRKKFHYAIGKAVEHERDADPTEWKSWETLAMMYLQLMLDEYAQTIES